MERSNFREYIGIEENEANQRTMSTIHSVDEIYKTYIPKTVTETIPSSHTSILKEQSTEECIDSSYMKTQNPNREPLVSSTPMQNYDISAPRVQFSNDLNTQLCGVDFCCPSTTTLKNNPKKEVPFEDPHIRIASGLINNQGGLENEGSLSWTDQSNNVTFPGPQMYNGPYYNQGPSQEDYYYGNPGYLDFPYQAIDDSHYQYQEQYPSDMRIDYCYCQQPAIPAMQTYVDAESQVSGRFDSGSQDRSSVVSFMDNDPSYKGSAQEEIDSMDLQSFVCSSQEKFYYDRLIKNLDSDDRQVRIASDSNTYGASNYSSQETITTPISKNSEGSCLEHKYSDKAFQMPEPETRKVRIATQCDGSASGASNDSSQGEKGTESKNTVCSWLKNLPCRKVRIANSSHSCPCDASKDSSQETVRSTGSKGSVCSWLKQKFSDRALKMPPPAIRDVMTASYGSASGASCCSQCSGSPYESILPDPGSCGSPEQSNFVDLEEFLRDQHQRGNSPMSSFCDICDVRITTESDGSAYSASNDFSQDTFISMSARNSECSCQEDNYSDRAFKMPNLESPRTRLETGSVCSQISSGSMAPCPLFSSEKSLPAEPCPLVSSDILLPDPSPCCLTPQSNVVDIESFLKFQQQRTCPPTFNCDNYNVNNNNQCHCMAYVNDMLQAETVYTTDYRPIACVGNQYSELSGIGGAGPMYSSGCCCQDMPLGGGFGLCNCCPGNLCPIPCDPRAYCPPPCGLNSCCPPPGGANPYWPPCGLNPCCSPFGANSSCSSPCNPIPYGYAPEPSCYGAGFSGYPCNPNPYCYAPETPRFGAGFSGPPCSPIPYCYSPEPPCCETGFSDSPSYNSNPYSTGIFNISGPCCINTPCCYPMCSPSPGYSCMQPPNCGP